MNNVTKGESFDFNAFAAFARKVSAGKQEAAPRRPNNPVDLENFDLNDYSSRERFIRFLWATEQVIRKMEEKHKLALREDYGKGAPAMMSDLKAIAEIRPAGSSGVSDGIRAFMDLVDGTCVREGEEGNFNYFLLSMMSDYSDHRLLKREVERVLQMYVRHNPNQPSVTASRVGNMVAEASRSRQRSA